MLCTFNQDILNTKKAVLYVFNIKPPSPIHDPRTTVSSLLFIIFPMQHVKLQASSDRNLSLFCLLMFTFYKVMYTNNITINRTDPFL